MGNSLILFDEYRGCPIVVGDRNCKVNLFPMMMHNFDIILGMDWLREEYNLDMILINENVNKLTVSDICLLVILL